MPCKTVVLPSDSMYFNPIYYRHMIGRAGRRGFDNIGYTVFYGVPSTKIKSFISSIIPEIKGQFSFDLNLIIQLAAMNRQTGQKSIQNLRSFVNNPILRLTCNSYKPEFCWQIVQLQVAYLFKKKLIDENFHASDKSNLIISMRNEKFNIELIYDLINSEQFKM